MSLTDEIVRAEGQRLIHDVPTLDLHGARLTVATLRSIATFLEEFGTVCLENCQIREDPGRDFEMLGRTYVLQRE